MTQCKSSSEDFLYLCINKCLFSITAEQLFKKFFVKLAQARLSYNNKYLFGLQDRNVSENTLRKLLFPEVIIGTFRKTLISEQ